MEIQKTARPTGNAFSYYNKNTDRIYRANTDFSMRRLESILKRKFRNDDLLKMSDNSTYCLSFLLPVGDCPVEKV
jgi:hypothetical protein